MKCDGNRRCPACGHFVVGTEKVRYSGKTDCRCDAFVFCPACGWKQRCEGQDDVLTGYRL